MCILLQYGLLLISCQIFADPNSVQRVFDQTFHTCENSADDQNHSKGPFETTVQIDLSRAKYFNLQSVSDFDPRGYNYEIQKEYQEDLTPI